MELDKQTSLLTSAIYLPSPYCDDRPANLAIDLIVIHGISLPPNQFGTGAVQKFFCGKLNFNDHPYYASIADLRVSSHLFISREGNVIQFVPFIKRAWHAGQSCFQRRERCNDFSIGIELEGADQIPYETIQYERLAAIIKILIENYKIPRQHIVGHSEIAPGRKTDPGPAFNWATLDCLLDS